MLNIVLYQPRIPQNTGNVARSCFVTGSRLHLVGPMGFRIDEAEAAPGGIDVLAPDGIVTYESWEEFLEKSRRSHDPDDEPRDEAHSQFQFEDGDYIVFGREDAGVPDAVHAQFGERQFRIPMIPSEEARCFNLATSVGIVLMEAERQLGYPGAGVRGTRNDHDLRNNCRGYSLL